MVYFANINGIDIRAEFCDDTVRDLFVPLLKELSRMHSEKKSRILVMLAAPPGAGKSTLVSFLEYLAKGIIPDKTLQSIGMDGFHRRQEDLLSNTAIVNGEEIPLVRIKGAPITFDLAGLRVKIKEITEKSVCKWPRYDRLLHNPIEDDITVDADIVLLEGNYLLLNEEGWRTLSLFADYTISISADEELLRERLIARRMATGVNKEDAEAFVDFSDMANVRLCLERSKEADLELEIAGNTAITRKSRT